MNRTPEGPWKQRAISIQKVCCRQRNGVVVDQIKWTGEHTLSSDILVRDHVNTCTPAKQVYRCRYNLHVQVSKHCSNLWKLSTVAHRLLSFSKHLTVAPPLARPSFLVSILKFVAVSHPLMMILLIMHQ